jgi:thiamine pyrophosphokinase
MVTVVCTGGDAPPVSLCLAWIDACSMTVAADGGLELLKRLGRRADLWVGDGDSLEGGPGGWGAWAREFRILDQAKDDSDTDAAVQAALDRGATEIWLVGGSGGRMDHWWSNQRLVARVPALKRWLTAREQGWTLGPGESLELTEGVVSVFPLGEGPWKVRSRGFRWPLEAVDFTTWHSLSNEVGPHGGQVASLAGRLLVLAPHGPGVLS